MAIPKATPGQETDVMALVAQQEKEEAAAKVDAKAQELKAQASETKAVAAPADTAKVGLTTVSTGDPMAFLAEIGITDVKLDFTSFPMVTLKDGQFSTSEHKNFGTEFNCVYLQKHPQFLFKADLGRGKEPELVYSSDGLHDNKEGRPVAEFIEDWKARSLPYEKSEYDIVIVQMIDGPHEGEVCQIQVSPASRGKLSGYLVTLAMKKLNPREVVTTVGVGAIVGSGVTAFNPFTFKQRPAL